MRCMVINYHTPLQNEVPEEAYRPYLHYVGIYPQHKYESVHQNSVIIGTEKGTFDSELEQHIRKRKMRQRVLDTNLRENEI